MKKTVRDIAIIFFIVALGFIPVFFGKINFPSNIYKAIPLYQNTKGATEHGYSISYQDILFNTYPWAKQDQSAVKNNSIPLWQFSNLAGYPLLGNDQSQFFFPLFYPLLYIVSFASAITIEAFLKIIFLSLGGYLFISLYTKRSISRITGSLIIAFNGFATMWLLWTVSSAFIFIPFILWIIEKSYREDIKSKYTIFAVSIFVALEILAGSLDVSLVFLIAIILFLIFLMIREKKVKRNVLISIFIGAFIGLLISMIQLYPAIIDLLRSYYFQLRFNNNIYDFLKSFNLLKFIYPGIYGVPWANSYQWVEQNFSETSFFISLPAFYLGLLSFADKSKMKSKIFAISLFTLIILIITGVIPFFYITQIPIFKNTLYHRMEAFIPLMYAILIALGIDSLYKSISSDNFEKIKKYTYIFLISISAISLLIFAKLTVTIYNTPTFYQSLKSLILQDFIVIIFILLVFIIINLKISIRYIKIIVAILILVFSITPLIIINYNFWQYTNQNLSHPHSKYTKLFSENKNYRVISTASISPPEMNVLSGFSEFEAYDPVIPNEYINYYNLIGHKDSVIYLMYSKLYPSSVKYLRLSSVKYVLLPFSENPPKGLIPIDNKNISVFTKYTTAFLKKFHIYSKNNLDAMYSLEQDYIYNHPFKNNSNVIQNIDKFLKNKYNSYVVEVSNHQNFYLSFKSKYRYSIEHILKLKEPGFLIYRVSSPLRIVYEPINVYQVSSLESRQIKKMKSVNKKDFSVTSKINSNIYNSTDRVKISGYLQGRNEIKFKVYNKSGKKVFISINELNYPGWFAKDNNKSIKLYRQNGIFDGITLSGKYNNVTLIYAPKNFNTGVYLTLLGLFLLLFVIII